MATQSDLIQWAASLRDVASQMEAKAGQAPVQAAPTELSFGPATVKAFNVNSMFNTAVVQLWDGTSELNLTVQPPPDALQGLPAAVPVVVGYNKGTDGKNDAITKVTIMATQVVDAVILEFQQNPDGSGTIGLFSDRTQYLMLHVTSVPATVAKGQKNVSFWYTTAGSVETILAGTVEIG